MFFDEPHFEAREKTVQSSRTGVQVLPTDSQEGVFLNVLPRLLFAMPFQLSSWLQEARLAAKQFAMEDFEAHELMDALRRKLEKKGNKLLVCLRKGKQHQFVWKGSKEDLEREIQALLDMGWELDPRVLVEAKPSLKRGSACLEAWT